MTVSVYGGSLLTELGPSGDVEYFFRCIKYFVEFQKKIQLPLVTDRLYKRYVDIDNFEELRGNISTIKSIFNETCVLSEDFEGYNFGINNRRLNKKEKNMRLLFDVYFLSFDMCMDSAESFYRRYASYTPLLIGRDITAPLFAIGTNDARDEEIRQLYDTLEGNPLWWGA